MSLLVALIVSAALPQQAVTPQTPRVDAEPDDIVVEGYREREGMKESTQPPAGVSTTRNRQTYEYSERLARCAARSRLSDRSRLRAVVDGEFNSPTHALAQDRLKRVYITCSDSTAQLNVTSTPRSALQTNAVLNNDNSVQEIAIDAAPLGHSIYDRGAFTIQALKQYAPGIKLTRAQTDDPAVQARFNAREIPRNRYRLGSDYRFFEVAVCMVRLEPRLATRLAMSEGPARIGDLQAALIDRARVCVGGARSVKVDPTQFRLYIADAVYRWAVAAHGVETLIPA